jgi:hypothetical protein
MEPKDFEYTLTEPLVSGEKTITVLHLDAGKLKGKDLKQLEVEYRLRYKDASLLPVLDSRFRELIAGKLNGIIAEDLESLNGRDYTAVLSKILISLGEF